MSGGARKSATPPSGMISLARGVRWSGVAWDVLGVVIHWWIDQPTVENSR